MNCFSSNSNSMAFLPRSITGDLLSWSTPPKEVTYGDSLLRARLLLSSSTRATLLRVNQSARGTGVFIQYADQSREAIDCHLLFRPIFNVVRDDLESGLRRFLVGNCTAEYRKDNRPLGLRADVDHDQTGPPKTDQWRAHLTMPGSWIKGTTPDTICSAAEKAIDDGSLPIRSRAMYSWSRMAG